MRTKTVKALFLSLVITLAAAAPAAAQGQFGAGLSFLNVEEQTGTGFTVDYSRPIRTMEPAATLGWVADLSLHGFEDNRATTIMGGVRYGREANENLDWFGQFLVGLAMSSPTGDFAEFCDAFDEDCSQTDLAFAPGFGVNIPINPSLNFRAQVDYLIIASDGESTSGPRFWFGISLPLGRSNP